MIGRQVRLHSGVAAFAHAVRLVDHGSGIPNQLDILRAARSGDLDGMEQGPPFGLLAATHADIALPVGYAARDGRHFHHAGIGPAAAIEKDT